MGNCISNSKEIHFDIFIDNLRSKSIDKLITMACDYNFNQMIDPRNGMNGLSYAIIYKNEYIANMMITFGSRLNVSQVENKQTPLMLAILNGMNNLALRICSYQTCLPDYYDIKSNTAFMYACSMKMHDVATYIWNKYGVINVNSYNDDFNTSLMLAAMAGFSEIVIEMINMCKNLYYIIEFKNNNGYAVIDIIRNTKMVDALKVINRLNENNALKKYIGEL